MSQERIAFENWLGIKPCGAAHDLAWAAWKARASLPAPQQATPDQFADASKMVPPVALRSVRLTRDTAGMCVVRINGRVAIRDNGDIIDHTATLEWFADTQQATPEPVEHKCRHCGVTTIEDEDGVTMYGLPAPDHPIMFDPSADVPIPATPEPLIVKGAMAGMVDAQVRDLWPTNGTALAAAQAKGGER